MIKRKIIYIILIVLLVLVAFEKVGLYDSSYVKVDNFIIKRPFLYREIADKSSIILDKYSSTVILFTSVFTQNGVIYSFSKVTNKKKFEVESEYSLKIKKVDISYCYVLKKDIQLGAKIIKENNIYRYPINFHLMR